MNGRKLIKKTLICLLIVGFWSIKDSQPVHATKSLFQKTDQAAQSGNAIFAVIGDYGLAGQSEADVAALVKSWNPDFIVTVGDNNYPNGAASTIDENIGQYYHDYIYPYNGKYGAGAPYKKFFPALGNHDWGADNGGRQYFKYFSFYNEQGYYDFINGSVHFFIIDSDPHEPDGTSVTSKQAKWLKSGLETSTSAFNIVVMHHAPFSSGRHGSTSYMQWPFKSWGADAVLTGHDHIYERILIDGFPYFVNGLGGAELYYLGTTVPGSQVRFNQDFGAMRVEANSQVMKFQFITRSGLLMDEYSIGKILPSVLSITRANPESSAASIAEFTVTFSEPVTGVDISDFSLNAVNITGASVINVNGTGNTYTVTANTGSGDGALRLDLIDNDSIVNASGNTLGDLGAGNGNFNNGETYNIDKTAPMVTSITRAGVDPSSAFSADFIVSFSEPVTGVDVSDFNLSATNGGASILSLNGSGTTFIVSVITGNSPNSIRLNLNDNDSILDFVGNNLGGLGAGNGGFNNGETYTIQKNAPSITSIVRAGTNPSNLASVDFIVTFSESVSNVDISDFGLTTRLNGASIINVINANPFYVVTVNTGSESGDLRLDLMDNDSIVNQLGTPLGTAGLGNGNFTSGEAYTIEKTPPIVTSIIRAGPNPTSENMVAYIVTFSKSVTGVDTADFGLTVSGINNAFITSVKNVDPFYVVTISSGNGAGTLRLDLLDDDSIMDIAGNNIGGAGLGNGNFVGGETYDVSRVSVNFPAPSTRDPKNNFLTNNPTQTFSWTKIKDASTYEVIVASDGGFVNVAIDQVVNGLSYTAFALSDGVYYWRVRAFTPDLQPGKFSATSLFTVDQSPPPFPTLTSPTNNFQTSKRPTFSWNKINEATKYYIEIDNNADFTSPEWAALKEDTSHRVTFMGKGIYFWRVRAKDLAGNWGGWSSIFSVTFK